MGLTDIATLDAASGTIAFAIAVDLYPREALYAAAYVFIDRAYVLLDRDDGRYIIRLRAKSAADELFLRALQGELENELLAQTLRLEVANANRRLIEQVTSLAIGGALGPRRSAEVAGSAPAAPVDDAMQFIDDPLGLGKPLEPEN